MVIGMISFPICSDEPTNDTKALRISHEFRGYGLLLLRTAHPQCRGCRKGSPSHAGPVTTETHGVLDNGERWAVPQQSAVRTSSQTAGGSACSRVPALVRQPFTRSAKDTQPPGRSSPPDDSPTGWKFADSDRQTYGKGIEVLAAFQPVIAQQAYRGVETWRCSTSKCCGPSSSTAWPIALTASSLAPPNSKPKNYDRLTKPRQEIKRQILKRVSKI